VSDAGLDYLQQMPHLVRLDVVETAITDAALRKYREGHPRMFVNR
jgi:hypothetical protein